MKNFINSNRQFIKWSLFLLWWSGYIKLMSKIHDTAALQGAWNGDDMLVFLISVMFFLITMGLWVNSGKLFVWSHPKLPKPVYHDNGIFYIKWKKENVKPADGQTSIEVTLFEDKLFYLKKINVFNASYIEDLQKKIQKSLDDYSNTNTLFIEKWNGDAYTSKAIERDQKLKKII